MRKIILSVGIIITILLLTLAANGVFAQTWVPVKFAIGRANDTAFTPSQFHVPSTVRIPFYSNSDTNKVLSVNAFGFLELRTKGGVGTQNWESVMNAGSTTTTDATFWDGADNRITIEQNGGEPILRLNSTLDDNSFYLQAVAASNVIVSYNRSTPSKALTVAFTIPADSDVMVSVPATKDGTLAYQQDLIDTAAAIRADFPSGGTSTSGGSVSFSYLDNAHDNAFMVQATAIIKNGGVYSPPDSIDWFILTTGGHGSSFFNSVAGNQSDQYLEISYPRAKYVFYCSANNDETLASYLLNIGATVGIDKARFAIYRPAYFGVKLTGQGTSTWIENDGNTNILDEDTYNTSDGSTKFNIGATVTYPVPYFGLSITYLGSHNYHIKRNYSALGMYNASFSLLDVFNNPVTVNPTSDDEVQIALVGQITQQVFAGTWGNGNEMLANSSANFWVTGVFELYMKVNPVSSTSNLVEWQTAAPNYTVTTYKIYRSTSPSFSSPVLITSSANPGSFTDTGLSAGTLYYYKEVGTVSGVDTEITTFNCRTKL